MIERKINGDEYKAIMTKNWIILIKTGVPKILRIEMKIMNGGNEIVATMILSERFFSPGIFAAEWKQN